MKAVGTDRADSGTQISKRQPAQPPYLASGSPHSYPLPSSAPELPAAHHAASPRHLLLPRNPGTPLDAEASVRSLGGGVCDGEVRGLLLEHPVVFCIGGGGCWAAGGEGAQLRDGGLRAPSSAAVGYPVPAHRSGERWAARGAHARGLGRGGAPPRQMGALPHRQGAPQVQEVQPRSPGRYAVAIRLRWRPSATYSTSISANAPVCS